MIIEYKNDRYDVKEVTLQDLIINNFPPRSLITLLDASSKEFNTMLGDKFCNSIILPIDELSFCFTSQPQWFIENGFTKKEETKLEPGMIVTSGIGERIVLQNYMFYDITGWKTGCAAITDYKLSDNTLEELNRESIYTWKIKEI